MLTPAKVQAQDRMELDPLTNWNLDYGEDTCVLRREFGTEGQSIYLETRHFNLEDDFAITLASRDFGRARGDPTLSFEPDSGVEPTEYAVIYINFGEGFDGLVVQSNLYPQALREQLAETKPKPANGTATFIWSPTDRQIRESEITGILVRGAFDQTVFLRTGPLHPPMTAVRNCVDDLVQSWGFDAVEQRSASRRVELNGQITMNQLRQKYRQRRLQPPPVARFRVRFDIDQSGQITACHFPSTVIDEYFKTEACEFYTEQAEFAPALDAQGNPMPSFKVFEYLNFTA